MKIEIAHPREYVAEPPLNLTYIGKGEDKRDHYLVSHSQLQDFLDCEHKHKLGYHDGWMLRSPAPALSFGSLFHLGLELWYAGKKWSTIRSTIYGEARKVASGLTSGSEHEQFMLDVDKLIAMLPAYYKNYRNDLTSGYEFVPEAEFDYPIVSTKSVVVRYRGKIDLLMRKGRNWYVMEHKTASRPDESYFARLRVDWQVYSYIWATKQITGKYPKEVIYDVTKKTQIRRKVKETRPEFIARVKEEYESHAQEKHYFLRYSIKPDKGQYKMWYDQIRQAAMRLVRKLRSDKPVWIMNTNQCVGKYGKCKFFSICMAGGNVSDMLYKLKEPEGGKK
jgi:hypothetical protein